MIEYLKKIPEWVKIATAISVAVTTIAAAAVKIDRKAQKETRIENSLDQLSDKVDAQEQRRMMVESRILFKIDSLTKVGRETNIILEIQGKAIGNVNDKIDRHMKQTLTPDQFYRFMYENQPKAEEKINMEYTPSIKIEPITRKP